MTPARRQRGLHLGCAIPAHHGEQFKTQHTSRCLPRRNTRPRQQELVPPPAPPPRIVRRSRSKCRHQAVGSLEVAILASSSQTRACSDIGSLPLGLTFRARARIAAINKTTIGFETGASREAEMSSAVSQMQYPRPHQPPRSLNT